MSFSAITIRDVEAQSSADILPGLGFNCFRFRAPVGGQSIDWLFSDPQFTSGTTRPSRSGIPILFPHPGRVAGAAYQWEGKSYRLEPTDGLGNAIHGFVHMRPWRIVDQAEHSLTGEFHASIDDKTILDHWPADFRVRATYELRGTALRLSIVVENTGHGTLPFSLGLHPYFRVPQGSPTADDCIIRMPVGERWEIENLLPTGRKSPLDPNSYASGARFGDLHLDDPFSGLRKTGESIVASVTDPASRTRLTIRWDQQFRELVAFTPPHREAICIEPYTAAPDAIHLQQRGVDAGLRVLQPGEQFRAWMELAPEATEQ
jgi:aldose 1-epimerase